MPAIASKRVLELGTHIDFVSYNDRNKTNGFKIPNIIKKEL